MPPLPQQKQERVLWLGLQAAHSVQHVCMLALPYPGHLHQDLIGCQDSWRNFLLISYLLSSSQQLAIQSSLERKEPNSQEAALSLIGIIITRPKGITSLMLPITHKILPSINPSSCISVLFWNLCSKQLSNFKSCPNTEQADYNSEISSPSQQSSPLVLFLVMEHLVLGASKEISVVSALKH